MLGKGVIEYMEFRGIEVHRSLNSYVSIQQRGIAGSPYSGSWLHSVNLSFKTQACRFLSLWTILLMEIGSHNLFSDASFGRVNIHSVRIQWSLYSKYWRLRPLSEGAVPGWAGVASQVVELLSIVCLLRYSLSNSSSFDKGETCRSYSRIWKYMSKCTT